MSDSQNNNFDDRTLIKPYEELEKSKASILNPESFPLLEIVQGPKRGDWFSIGTQEETTLGRSATNSIILEDNSVSRTHALIQKKAEGYLIRDIGSRNGTFCKGKRIQEPTLLKHMDQIKVGIYTMRFLEEATEEPVEAKEEPSSGDRLDILAPLESDVSQSQSSSDSKQSTESTEEEVESTHATEEQPPEDKLPEIAEEPSEPTPIPETEEAQAEPEESPLSEPEQAVVPKEEKAPVIAVPKPKKKRKKVWLMMVIILLLIIGGGTFFAYQNGTFDRFFESDQPVAKTDSPPGPDEDPNVVSGKPDAPKGELIPVFLEAISEPEVDGKVFYKGKEVGVTPFNIPLRVPAGQPQELSAEFYLESVNEKYAEKRSFEVAKQDDVVKVTFQPKLGSLKVLALPAKGDLYLEGKFSGKSGPTKSIQLKVAFDEPVYLPFGNYVAEIKVPETLSGSRSKVQAVRYRREFSIGPNQKEFVINAPEESLNTFPAKIQSKPSEADLLIDGKKVGTTPFQGDLPTGRHKLTLKKEGFDPFNKEINIEMNTPYEASFNLKTSPAGNFINQGREFLKKQMYNEAIAKLAEALKRSPNNNEKAQIHILLGEAFLKNKTYDQALAYYRKAAEDPAQAQRAKLGQALAQNGLGQRNQALVSVVNVYMNTKDKQLKSKAAGAFAKISPAKSLIYIATQPPGAQVLLNGKPIQQVTPMILSDLMIGSYRVEINKPGFKTYKAKIQLPLAAIKPVVVTLEPEGGQ